MRNASSCYDRHRSAYRWSRSWRSRRGTCVESQVQSERERGNEAPDLVVINVPSRSNATMALLPATAAGALYNNVPRRFQVPQSVGRSASVAARSPEVVEMACAIGDRMAVPVVRGGEPESRKLMAELDCVGEVEADDDDCDAC